MLPSKGGSALPNKVFSDVNATIVKTENFYSKGKISFFGAEPIEQQTIDYSIESIVDALKAYGLASKNTLWYLQEGPFSGTDGPNPPYNQGFSVDISNDGNTAIVGGPGFAPAEGTTLFLTDVGDGNIGGVWVFTRDSLNVWKQQQRIIPDDYTGIPNMGWSVSISGDGNTIAFGGPSNEDGSGWYVGATWVYTRSNGVWTQQDILIGTDYTSGNNVMQGYSISLSYSGDTLIVGGPYNNTLLIVKGALWIFQRTDGVWAQQAGPIVPEYDGSELITYYLGQTVDISNDGNTMVTTGIINGTSALILFIYTRTNGIWSKYAEFEIVEESELYLQVSISGDSKTIAIGRYLNGSTEGTVDIYVNNNGTWSKQTTLLGTGSFNSQGVTVSLSDDGDTVIFTGFTDDGSSMWVFNREDEIWTQNGIVIGIGGSVISTKISGDGRTAITGYSNDEEIRIYRN